MAPGHAHSHTRTPGFTLIEVVAVLVLLGLLAAVAVPVFVNLSADARAAQLRSLASSFNAGVEQVHAYWLAKGSPGPQLNMIPLPAGQAGGDLSVNASGWPADTRGVSLTLNSTDDCLDVWRAVMQPGAPSVSASPGSDFQALYLGGNNCRYTSQVDTTQSLEFYSNTGQVVVNL